MYTTKRLELVYIMIKQKNNIIYIGTSNSIEIYMSQKIIH